MNPKEIKKNLLDLEYNKYLQYFNTSIILLFTYFIGISIAVFTKQLDYNNWNRLVSVLVLSSIFLCTSFGFMLHFKYALVEIESEIKRL